MAYEMIIEPQDPTILYPWGCPCLVLIQGDFVPKGVEQFGCSSQAKDLEYEKYSMLLIQEEPILVVLIEKRKGE